MKYDWQNPENLPCPAGRRFLLKEELRTIPKGKVEFFGSLGWMTSSSMPQNRSDNFSYVVPINTPFPDGSIFGGEEKKIEWHNPGSVTQEKLGEGWRFLLLEEYQNKRFYNLRKWYEGKWVCFEGEWNARHEDKTYSLPITTPLPDGTIICPPAQTISQPETVKENKKEEIATQPQPEKKETKKMQTENQTLPAKGSKWYINGRKVKIVAVGNGGVIVKYSTGATDDFSSNQWNNGNSRIPINKKARQGQLGNPGVVVNVGGPGFIRRWFNRAVLVIVGSILSPYIAAGTKIASSYILGFCSQWLAK